MDLLDQVISGQRRSRVSFLAALEARQMGLLDPVTSGQIRSTVSSWLDLQMARLGARRDSRPGWEHLSFAMVVRERRR